MASFWLLWQRHCLRGRQLEEEEEEERTKKRGCAEKKVTAKTEPSGGEFVNEIDQIIKKKIFKSI